MKLYSYEKFELILGILVSRKFVVSGYEVYVNNFQCICVTYVAVYTKVYEVLSLKCIILAHYEYFCMTNADCLGFYLQAKWLTASWNTGRTSESLFFL